VILKKRRAQPFFGRHPWVFAGAIDRIETQPEAKGQGAADEIDAGTSVELWTHEGRFVAHGLFNAHSNIRVRLYSWDQQAPVDGALIAERISAAVELRRSLFDLTSDHTGCRLVFSEADQLSGLTVDFYSGYLLVQFTSLAMYQFREAIVDALEKELAPKGIWLRTEKGMREAEGLDVVDGLIRGAEPPRPLFISEHGVQYGVDVQQGQKTGCYLDQRDNRLAAARYTKDARVLDAFCFSGGFGITALCQGQAASVVGVDSSEGALTIAAANAQMNGVADRAEYRRGDVKVILAEMAEQGSQFDVVVLDPPRMARTRGGLNRAIKGYLRLNTLGLQVLRPGGILVTCSCSGLVSRSDFLEMIAEVSRSTGRHIQILEQHGQPADHPVAATCPESEYLKMLICRVM
jgi:23S rRNA (cytosine1962-C5)-methyltransferase